MTSLVQRTAGITATALLVATPLVAVAPTALAASSVPCHAGVSDSTPRDYTSVYVYVTTSSYASVRTAAHYKTTTTYHGARASSSGHATIRYYISGATPGRRVPVTVAVTKNGRHGYCSTSFVPHR